MDNPSTGRGEGPIGVRVLGRADRTSYRFDAIVWSPKIHILKFFGAVAVGRHEIPAPSRSPMRRPQSTDAPLLTGSLRSGL
jgi:hypothetical protein